MNFQAIKYLSALAVHRHFGKAARACFVSQPTLSMQIKKLEDSLGVQLLERTNKSVMLTAIGALLAERANTILSEINGMKETAKMARDPYGGELKLGIIPTLAPYLLPHIIPSLTQAFPKLSLYLVEEQTAHLVQKLQSGQLDAAILALPISDQHFSTMQLFEEEFLLAVPKQHPLTKNKKIKQADLDDQNLLLLEEGHCLREQTLDFCHKMQASENKDFRATSLETLRHMVAAGVGLTLIPQLACKSNDAVHYIKLSENTPKRVLGLVWRPTTAKTKLLREIAENIKNTMEKKYASE